MSTETEPPTATRRSYRPGAWFGIFGPHVTVLLPPTEKHRVATVWEMVDDGAGFDEVLDALISGGLRELPGFVLLSEGDDSTKVVLRGAATARFSGDEGDVELVGSSVTTWVERSLTGVTSSVIEVGESAAGDLPVADGLAKVSRVDTPPYAAAPAEQQDAHPGEDATTPAEEPHPAEQVVPGEEVDLSVTEAMPVVPPAPTPPGPAPARPVPTPVGIEHDGMTRAGSAAPADSVPPPGIPGQPQAPGVTARPVARLVLSSGDSVEVDRAVLVGRAPVAPRFGSAEEPRVVTVPSPNQEISSTHLEIRPGSGVDHGVAIVTDLGSTNGTLLVQPGLPPEELHPGIATQLVPGAIIDLGDGVTIQVTNP